MSNDYSRKICVEGEREWNLEKQFPIKLNRAALSYKQQKSILDTA